MGLIKSGLSVTATMAIDIVAADDAVADDDDHHKTRNLISKSL